jgi:toxin-antitoxin system PIN domain toxin
LIALPDVNVLLALAWQPHVHHDAAHAWFQKSAQDGWATCLFSQAAFVRLSMNPHVVHSALDCSGALRLLSGLVAHPHHRFFSGAPALSESPFDAISPLVSGYRQMSDATLLFLARTHGLKLVTFDQAVLTLSPWPESVQVLKA